MQNKIIDLLRIFSLAAIIYEAMLLSSCESISRHVTYYNNCKEINPLKLQQKARAVLTNYTYAEDPILRSNAIESLAKSHQITTLEIILSGLDDPYWGVRFTSALALMELKPEKAIPILKEKIKKEENKSVKAAIAAALHSMGNEEFTSIIGNALFDKDPIVRRNAALILGRLADRRAIKILRYALRDDDLSVKLQVLEALTLLGDSRAQRLMLDSYLRSYYDDEKILAILALAEAGVEEAKDRLIEIFQESSDPQRLGMRLVAARGLAMLGDMRGKNTAIKALNFKSKDSEKEKLIQTLSALALAYMPEDKHTLCALAEKLTDNNPQVRIAAAFAILKITTKY